MPYTKGGLYDLVIGFNDSLQVDGDYDDFVIGLRVTAVPEPESYALMLAGLVAVGFHRPPPPVPSGLITAVAVNRAGDAGPTSLDVRWNGSPMRNARTPEARGVVMSESSAILNPASGIARQRHQRGV